MYYPIIDKLKEVMADVTSVKNKEPLIIEGTVTSETGGIWTGNYSDITNAFSNNRMVLFKVIVQGETIIVPVFDYNSNFSTSVCFPFYVHAAISTVYGLFNANNTFNLVVIQ